MIFFFLISLSLSLPSPLPQVALEFLDSEFTDEYVREFAVAVLKQLPDDKLEGVLLQLVQALKFEAHHDSPLARFLIGRALQNRRIGHFFFWSVKCYSEHLGKLALMMLVIACNVCYLVLI